MSQSAKETIAWGKEFAASLKVGDVLCLSGDLGAGKTTLVKGIAQGLGLPADQPVTSPTFVIMHRYACRMPLYHFDCYRVQSPEDLATVGFEDFLNQGGGVACIEWPEKAGNLIPEHALLISIKHQAEHARLIEVTNKR